MGQSKFGKASGWNAMKDSAVGQAKASPGGRMFFGGGLGGGLAKSMISPKDSDSTGFAGENEGKTPFGQPGFQGKGKGLRMAGLFGGLGGLFGGGRAKKRFGLF